MITDLATLQYETWPSIPNMRKIKENNYDFIAYVFHLTAQTDEHNYPVMNMEVVVDFFVDFYEGECRISYDNSKIALNTYRSKKYEPQKKKHVIYIDSDDVKLKQTHCEQYPFQIPVTQFSHISSQIIDIHLPCFLDKFQQFLHKNNILFEEDEHNKFIHKQMTHLKNDLQTTDHLNNDVFSSSEINVFFLDNSLDKPVEQKNNVSKPKI